MPVRKYAPAELRQFLAALDARLHRSMRINVMGGGAIALAHGVDRNTSDLDLFETNKRDLQTIKKAVAKVRQETGLSIEVSAAGGAVGDWPYHSDERMIRVMPQLKNLAVYALEKHDVALSKALRGDENDIVAIQQLHQQVGLDKDILVERYLKEMTHVIGNRARLDQNFVLLIDRLFGEIEADQVRQQIARR
jgi:hypothetical protein